MKLSIVILFTFDKEALYVHNILKWILQNESQYDYEVMIVSNGNQTKLAEFQKQYADQKNFNFILNQKNLGYGQGNHQGIVASKGEFVLILNPDIELYKSNIDLMVRYMEDQKNVGVLAPQLIYEDGTVQDVYRRFPNFVDFIIKRTFLRNLPVFRYRVFKYLMHDKNPELIEDVDWVVGACLLIRREMYDEVEGFDPRYFLFLEDTDLCRLMWEKGHRVIYFPKAKATHYHQRLSDGGVLDIFRKKTVRIHIMSAIKYFMKFMFRKRPHVTPRLDV